MNPALSVLTPQRIATEAFTDATAAVARLDEIYQRNTRFLRDRFATYARGLRAEACDAHRNDSKR